MPFAVRPNAPRGPHPADTRWLSVTRNYGRCILGHTHDSGSVAHSGSAQASPPVSASPRLTRRLDTSFVTTMIVVRHKGKWHFRNALLLVATSHLHHDVPYPPKIVTCANRKLESRCSSPSKNHLPRYFWLLEGGFVQQHRSIL